MRLSLLAICALSVCLVVLAGGAVVNPVAAGVDEHSSGDNVTQTIEVDIDEDGDAEFRLITTVEAETEPQRQAFEEVATAFERGQFEEQSLWPAALAVFDDVNDETARDMQLEGPQRDATLNEEDGVGLLVESFEWGDFANESNEQLEVGDAWTQDGELWFRSLDQDQQLTLRTPPGYEIEEAQPDSFRDRALVWEGPRSFQHGDLSATYSRTGSGSLGSLAIILGGVVIALLILSGLLYAQRADTDLLDNSGGETANNKPATPAEPKPQNEGETTEEPQDESDDDEETAPVDPELLSDEERVERLLRKNDGRMKQATIVKETGWSNAKVSQLLSEMNEEGRVDKLRLGRENLIALPEEEVTELE